MDKKQLDEIKKRHGVATSGVLYIEKGDFHEWVLISGSGDEDDDVIYDVATCYNLSDAEFFAHVHNDIEALLAENARLLAALERRNNAIEEAVEIANIDFPQSQMNAAAWELKRAIDQIAEVIQVADDSVPHSNS